MKKLKKPFKVKNIKINYINSKNFKISLNVL